MADFKAPAIHLFVWADKLATPITSFLLGMMLGCRMSRGHRLHQRPRHLGRLPATWADNLGTGF
jgi:hypothetical protein